MIDTEIKGSISLKPIEEFFIENIAARTTAKTAAEFVNYLKNRRFDELFENQTGKTRESIGLYRWKSKAPAYVVKAGVGVPGNLNYLAGLYRGKAVSRSGKVFSYARKRDLITEGWKVWDGDTQMANIGENMMQKSIGEAEKKIEG